MRWTRGDRRNVEDMRGRSASMRMGGIGLGGLLLVLLLTWFTGMDFLSLLGGGGVIVPEPAGTSGGPVTASPEEERLVDFVDAVMEDAQSVWSGLLDTRYRRTTTVLFRDAIQSACGFAQSATGPFYCPADQRVYLDLGFFTELQRRFGAPGDFAQAYVLTHELGHHVQSLLGIERQVRQLQQARPDQANQLSVRMELQADCFAGVWGRHAAQPGRSALGRVELEPGDLEEGLNAAAAIGDDRLQRMAGTRVAPDRFTHGTSQQRVSWFRRGFETGDPQACETFQ
ncbi:MAG TPA: neutral zinc metallopeptidase [Vicinamibacterales bacterium]|nr:neutral zinc metallopeptidase [Vicinamibacterales bacterium]